MYIYNYVYIIIIIVFVYIVCVYVCLNDHTCMYGVFMRECVYVYDHMCGVHVCVCMYDYMYSLWHVCV